MRIGIDVRYLSHGLLGGVHTYVRHFVPELLSLASDHQVFLYADTKRPFELSGLPAHVTLRRMTWTSPLSSVYHDLFMRRQMRRDQIDVAHFPANYGLAPKGVSSVVTLHDEINLLPLSEVLGREFFRGNVKSFRTAAMRFYLHAWSTAAVQRADRILTVSKHAADQISRHSGIDASRITAIPHGLSHDLRRITDQLALGAVRTRHDLPARFVVADALKNPAVLVRAWRLLPEQLRLNRRIVFFSRRPDVLPIVHEAIAAGDARLLIRPDRPDLIALYSMADAFVFPSWIEGFGIPVLEAMTCGAPVIASNRGSIPEIAGDAALFADAEDERTLAEHLLAVLERPAVRRELQARGYARAKEFSWAKTARGILDAYQVAADRRALARAA